MIVSPPVYLLLFLSFGVFLFSLLILERGEGREGERERDTDVRDTLVASCTHPFWGPNLQPRLVP